MYNEKVHIGNLGAALVYEPNPLAKRLSALDQLREIATAEPFTHDTVRAIKSISAGIYCESLLVRQKCVFALGQSRYPAIVPILQEQLSEKENDVVVRLEAAKGLALLRYPGQEVQTMVELLTVRYDDEEEQLVKDAAEVAAARMGWEMKAEETDINDTWFGCVDVAPPFLEVPEDSVVEYLAAILLDDDESLFRQCRAMTTLRNLCISEESTWSDDETISKVAYELTRAHQTKSSFIRHQLILTLGQISHETTIPYLLHQLQDDFSEDCWIRAAAAEILADFTYEKEVVGFMQDFEDDEVALVRECVSLALTKAEGLQTFC